jgi:hypothetical protein
MSMDTHVSRICAKAFFGVIGSRQQLCKVEIDSIRVGTSDIKPVTSVRNLGVWFDSNMSMDSHVSRICAKAFFGLYKIRQIRKYLSADVTKTLVHAYVTSHLDYGNSLLVGISGKNIQRLQRVLNSAARVVCLSPKFDHITPHLIELHWLPVKARISFKVLLLVYKALNGMAPSYLADMVRLRRGNRYSLRADTDLLLQVPATCRSFGDRAFFIAGPSLWNRLPQSIMIYDYCIGHKVSFCHGI